MTAIIRTPEERFEGLPGWSYEPRYEELDGLRLARVDEGDGHPVVFLHGEPTWSYLWRKVMPPVQEAGYRVIAPDLPGFGRSDKPADIGWYSYDRHTELLRELLMDRLGLRGATFVVHDWGGMIGLRLAAEQPELVGSLVVMDTGLATGHQRMSEAWLAFRSFVERTEDLPVGFLVKGGCHSDLADEVVAAYDAPYAEPAAKAGARAFPLMVPTSPDAPGAAAGRAALEALRADERPKLVLWGDSDPILPFEVGRRVAEAINGPEPEPIAGGGHFLQEDAGDAIGRRIAAWLQKTVT